MAKVFPQDLLNKIIVMVTESGRVEEVTVEQISPEERFIRVRPVNTCGIKNSYWINTASMGDVEILSNK
jgi:hypothetical protein